MEIVVVLFLVVCGIGALIVGSLGLVAFISWWWIAIPLVCSLIGGWIGFFFGVGLDVVIGFFILMVNSVSEGGSATAPNLSSSRQPELQITHTELVSTALKNIQTINGDSFIPCPKCNERNNPTFSKCWKCGGVL